MEGARRRKQVAAALLAAVAAAASDWGYLGVIHGQNALPPLPGIVAFITWYIAAIALAAVVGMACALGGQSEAAKTVLLSAAAGSAVLGFLAIFSVGLALLITAALLSVAARTFPPARRPRAWLWPASGALIAIATLIGGLVVVGTF